MQVTWSANLRVLRSDGVRRLGRLSIFVVRGRCTRAKCSAAPHDGQERGEEGRLVSAIEQCLQLEPYTKIVRREPLHQTPPR